MVAKHLEVSKKQTIRNPVTLKGSSLAAKQARTGYLFIFPLILGVLFIFGPNIIQSVIFSINDIVIGGDGYSLKSVGIEYFRQALTVNPEYNRLLTNTIKGLITDVPVIIIFSIFIASILNQKFRGRVLARIVFFIPVLLATGIVARIEMDTNLLAIASGSRQLDTGMAADQLQMMGIAFFLESLDFSPVLIDVVVGAANSIYQVVSASGIQIFIFLAALQEIPESLYEAAQVEGCTGWEIFWKITFPMISPLIIVNAVYTIVDVFTQPNNPLFRYTENLAFGQNQFGLASAMIWIYFIVVAVILAISGLVISRFVFYNE